MACAAVFGERMKRLPISSNKSMIGHTLTAAGAIEAVVSLMTIRHGVHRRRSITTSPTRDRARRRRERRRAARVDTVMSNSFGFGGQNVVLVLQGEPR